MCLIIVDSLSSINARGENNIEGLRDVLGFFIELARAFDVALLLIHHLRKPREGIAQPVTMHDLRGTGHLVAMARSILSIDIIKKSKSPQIIFIIFNCPLRKEVR